MKEIKEKATIVSLSSIKGGVGKTSICIKLADCLASAGYKVLLVDSDLNNSLSFHYLDDLSVTGNCNFAAALSNEENNLCDFAVSTRVEGIHLIASSPHLSDLRAISERRLKRMIHKVDGVYDIVIIDCHPTYDNIVLNALHASDYVITPVLKDTFSFNAADYFSKVLPRDVEDLENWFVLINGYDARFENAKSGKQNDFIKLYQEKKLPLTPPETWVPWTAALLNSIDYDKKISVVQGVHNSIYHPALYNAMVELAGCFVDDDDFCMSVPEVF